MNTNEKHTLMLTQLVEMLHFAALQQMGKLKNPISDKIERDLHQAQATIDMIEMLHTKMKGNLGQEEERLFSAVLQEVRLNYVDEAGKSQPTDRPQSATPQGTT